MVGKKQKTGSLHIPQNRKATPDHYPIFLDYDMGLPREGILVLPPALLLYEESGHQPSERPLKTRKPPPSKGEKRVCSEPVLQVSRVGWQTRSRDGKRPDYFNRAEEVSF